MDNLESKISATTSSKSDTTIFTKILPVLDEAVSNSHSCEELIQVGLTAVVGVLVGSLITSFFKK